ncbi:uncharacterized protein PV07_00772 [Cladophialophora immunda]|uniref:Uncharacterized protein n=1 Tax=Cladophialophora immunda TaxID=569365 RepID=A0A0D2A0M3_9EURO|nr:uncharacterized protein PV07_00772 [Cladophialophora immunda]KIW33961.1 hypothetical protein PV07_00772 [Cladophialophora immunda]
MANLQPPSAPGSRNPPDPNRHAPRDYAAAVHRHSLRSKEHHLFTGTNYRSLALFLRNKNSRASAGAGQAPGLSREHDILIIHDLTPAGRRITRFNSLTGLQDFHNHPLPADHCGQLVFLRGLPSPEWVNAIGARYRVDPELFWQHLPLTSGHATFDLPALASAACNIAKLTVTSIGHRTVGHAQSVHGGSSVLEPTRMSGSVLGPVGQSIVRKVSIHDEQNFSIEQDVHISIIKRGEGWLALILIDSGRDLDEGWVGAWDSSLHQCSRVEEIFSPVIMKEPRVCFQGADEGENPPVTAQRRPFSQSTSLLSGEQYGYYLHAPTMRVDAFYALHDVFAFVASAENQFLNMLNAKYLSNTRRYSTISQLEKELTNLRYHNMIVRDHASQLQRTIDCIQNRWDPHWIRPKRPRPPNRQSPPAGPEQGPEHLLAAHESEVQRTEAAASMLLRDFHGLLRKAQELSQRYNERIDEIRTSNMLAESRKATEQARSVTRLSLLAFLFLPLSFTTSFFGMNFRELGPDLSLWIWAVTSVPVFVFALLCCFWADVVKGISLFGRRGRKQSR